MHTATKFTLGVLGLVTIIALMPTSPAPAPAATEPAAPTVVDAPYTETKAPPYNCARSYTGEMESASAALRRLLPGPIKIDFTLAPEILYADLPPEVGHVTIGYTSAAGSTTASAIVERATCKTTITVVDDQDLNFVGPEL